MDLHDLQDRLATCNYAMVRHQLISAFGGSVIPKELIALLDQFVADPGFETAVALINHRPEFLAFFEMAFAGGFTESIYRHRGSAIFRRTPEDEEGDFDDDFDEYQ